MNHQTNTTTLALNRLRAATGIIGIVETGLNADKLSRKNALKMIDFCKWVATQNATEKEEERLLTSLQQGLARIAEVLSQHDPLELKNEVAELLPQEMSHSTDAYP